MNIRAVREDDIEAIIQLFRANYGEDYAMPEFYDPQWVKRGVYSDHILWLVIEEEGRIAASGACILNSGDYNDQIGELGRIVVDPTVSGRGLGRALLTALVDASDNRVEFAFAEARTVHPKTQKIDDRIGLVALGFLPMYYRMSWRESLVLSGQLFGNGRAMRRVGSAQVISEIAPLAELSLKNLELIEPVIVASTARAYPVEHLIEAAPLTGADLVRLLKIEHGRVVEPEVFGSMHVDQGLSQLSARKATYLVATDGDRTLGAVGYLHDDRNDSVRIIELIAEDEAVKGGLLRLAVEKAEEEHAADVVKCDVCASSTRIQQTLLELGFLPAAYVPGMVFHGTGRLDIVKMMKLNVPWDLGPMELTEPSQRYHDIVVPAFEQAAGLRAHKSLALGTGLMAGFSPVDAEIFQRACQPVELVAGGTLAPGGLYLVVAGAVNVGGRRLEAGNWWGAQDLLRGGDDPAATAEAGARLLSLSRGGLNRLAERHPRLAVKLYQNLVSAGAS